MAGWGAAVGTTHGLYDLFIAGCSSFIVGVLGQRFLGTAVPAVGLLVFRNSVFSVCIIGPGIRWQQPNTKPASPRFTTNLATVYGFCGADDCRLSADESVLPA